MTLYTAPSRLFLSTHARAMADNPPYDPATEILVGVYAVNADKKFVVGTAKAPVAVVVTRRTLNTANSAALEMRFYNEADRETFDRLTYNDIGAIYFAGYLVVRDGRLHAVTKDESETLAGAKFTAPGGFSAKRSNGDNREATPTALLKYVIVHIVTSSVFKTWTPPSAPTRPPLVLGAAVPAAPPGAGASAPRAAEEGGARLPSSQESRKRRARYVQVNKEDEDIQYVGTTSDVPKKQKVQGEGVEEVKKEGEGEPPATAIGKKPFFGMTDDQRANWLAFVQGNKPPHLTQDVKTGNADPARDPAAPAALRRDPDRVAKITPALTLAYLGKSADLGTALFLQATAQDDAAQRQRALAYLYRGQQTPAAAALDPLTAIRARVAQQYPQAAEYMEMMATAALTNPWKVNWKSGRCCATKQIASHAFIGILPGFLVSGADLGRAPTPHDRPIWHGVVHVHTPRGLANEAPLRGLSISRLETLLGAEYVRANEEINARLVVVEIRQMCYLGMVALETIRPGAPIVVHYGEEWSRIARESHPDHMPWESAGQLEHYGALCNIGVATLAVARQPGSGAVVLERASMCTADPALVADTWVVETTVLKLPTVVTVTQARPAGATPMAVYHLASAAAAKRVEIARLAAFVHWLSSQPRGASFGDVPEDTRRAMTSRLSRLSRNYLKVKDAYRTLGEYAAHMQRMVGWLMGVTRRTTQMTDALLLNNVLVANHPIAQYHVLAYSPALPWPASEYQAPLEQDEAAVRVGDVVYSVRFADNSLVYIPTILSGFDYSDRSDSLKVSWNRVQPTLHVLRLRPPPAGSLASGNVFAAIDEETGHLVIISRRPIATNEPLYLHVPQPGEPLLFIRRPVIAAGSIEKPSFYLYAVGDTHNNPVASVTGAFSLLANGEGILAEGNMQLDLEAAAEVIYDDDEIEQEFVGSYDELINNIPVESVRRDALQYLADLSRAEVETPEAEIQRNISNVAAAKFLDYIKIRAIRRIKNIPTTDDDLLSWRRFTVYEGDEIYLQRVDSTQHVSHMLRAFEQGFPNIAHLVLPAFGLPEDTDFAAFNAAHGAVLVRIAQIAVGKEMRFEYTMIGKRRASSEGLGDLHKPRIWVEALLAWSGLGEFRRVPNVRGGQTVETVVFKYFHEPPPVHTFGQEVELEEKPSERVDFYRREKFADVTGEKKGLSDEAKGVLGEIEPEEEGDVEDVEEGEEEEEETEEDQEAADAAAEKQAEDIFGPDAGEKLDKYFEELGGGTEGTASMFVSKVLGILNKDTGFVGIRGLRQTPAQRQLVYYIIQLEAACHSISAARERIIKLAQDVDNPAIKRQIESDMKLLNFQERKANFLMIKILPAVERHDLQQAINEAPGTAKLPDYKVETLFKFLSHLTRQELVSILKTTSMFKNFNFKALLSENKGHVKFDFEFAHEYLEEEAEVERVVHVTKSTSVPAKKKEERLTSLVKSIMTVCRDATMENYITESIDEQKDARAHDIANALLIQKMRELNRHLTPAETQQVISKAFVEEEKEEEAAHQQVEAEHAVYDLEYKAHYQALIAKGISPGEATVMAFNKMRATTATRQNAVLTLEHTGKPPPLAIGGSADVFALAAIEAVEEEQTEEEKKEEEEKKKAAIVVANLPAALSNEQIEQLEEQQALVEAGRQFVSAQRPEDYATIHAETVLLANQHREMIRMAAVLPEDMRQLMLGWTKESSGPLQLTWLSGTPSTAAARSSGGAARPRQRALPPPQQPPVQPPQQQQQPPQQPPMASAQPQAPPPSGAGGRRKN